MKTLKLTIEGMVCSHCVAHVKDALQSVGGVLSAEVGLTPPRAVITASKEISLDVLQKAIAERGEYKIAIEETA